MLTFFDSTDPDAATRHPRLPSMRGVLSTSYEDYPQTIVDPHTGFMVAHAGANLFLHVSLDVDSDMRPTAAKRNALTQNRLKVVSESLAQIAFGLNPWFEYTNGPAYIFGATHVAMARTALTFGFSYLVPEQSLFSTSFMERLEQARLDLRENGINAGDSNKAHLTFMRVSDLNAVYGRRTSPEQLAQLRAKARAETLRLRRLTALATASR